MKYKTQGVCSREISFEVENNKLKNVKFVGGCAGNTQGVARLVEGMDIDDVIVVTVHTVTSREVFSCVFCAKIPGYTARNCVLCSFCVSRSVLLFTSCRFWAWCEQ